MKIGESVVLEEIARFAVFSRFVRYTDVEGATVVIPISVLARLYEGAKADHEYRFPETAWDDFVEREISRGDR